MMADQLPVVAPVSPKDETKEIVLRFAAGASLADVATFYGKNRSTVERVLRQAHNRLLTDINEVADAAKDRDQMLAKAIDVCKKNLDQVVLGAEAFRALSFWQRLRWLLRGE